MCRNYDIGPIILALALTGGVLYTSKSIWEAASYIKSKTMCAISSWKEHVDGDQKQMKQIQDDLADIKNKINRIVDKPCLNFPAN